MLKDGFLKNYSRYVPIFVSPKITQIAKKVLMVNYCDDITKETQKIKLYNNPKTHKSIIAPSNFKGMNEC